MPKAFKDPAALKQRLTQIDNENVRALNQYVKALSKAKGEDYHIPLFDPADGGVGAKILLVLEAPGGRASGSARSSGFVSTDNNDSTAKNMSEFETEAGLERHLLVHWNIVPWYVGSGKKIRNSTAEEAEDGANELEKVLLLLPKLRVIVLLGQISQKAYCEHFINKQIPNVTVLLSPHPSQRPLNHAPLNKNKIISVLRQAGELIRT